MSRRVIPNEMHNRVMMMYSWADVGRRTEVIYNRISKNCLPSLATRFARCVPPCCAVIAPLSACDDCWLLPCEL